MFQTSRNVAMPNYSALTDLPPLMPLFLRKRRMGLAAVEEIAGQLGVERSLLFTLTRVREVQGMYGGEPVSLAQLREGDPYRAVDGYSGPLSILEGEGLIVKDGNKGVPSFALSPRAWEAVERLHAEGRAHVARLQPLPQVDLARLAHQLERAVDAIVADPTRAPRPGSHLMGALSLEVSREGAPAMVRIEQAIFDLWMARDDAHIKAWRDADMEGPPMDVVWLLWQGKAHTVSQLQEALQHDQTPTDLESSLLFLIEKGHVTRHGDEVQLTPQGVLMREDIERDTDRIYFAPWPHTSNEGEWVREKMREMVDELPAPVPPTP